MQGSVEGPLRVVRLRGTQVGVSTCPDVGGGNGVFACGSLRWRVLCAPCLRGGSPCLYILSIPCAFRSGACVGRHPGVHMSWAGLPWRGRLAHWEASAIMHSLSLRSHDNVWKSLGVFAQCVGWLRRVSLMERCLALLFKDASSSCAICRCHRSVRRG